MRTAKRGIPAISPEQAARIGLKLGARWSLTQKVRQTPVIVMTKDYDGDTFWLMVDTAFRGRMEVNIRLDGVDCPELHPRIGTAEQMIAESSAAREALLLMRDWVGGHLAAGHDVWVDTLKDTEKYGRWLGKLYCKSCTSDLAQVLMTQGLAIPSTGTAKWRDTALQSWMESHHV